MSNDLFTFEGQRKYLTDEEIERFIASAQAHERANVRTLCLVLAYTGCRISEALQLSAERVDVSEKTIRFRTLKQRGGDVFRAVPVPEILLDTLELVHGVRKAQRGRKGQGKAPLWPWGRTQAWKHITATMAAANVIGPHATPKGLRHGFGVKAASRTRNPRMVQKWLGHRSIETTMIYMDAVGAEERDLAASMWQ